ncbi:MAG: hypothetical protein AB8B79_01175 [Granulosicoccus sp.]
MKLTQRQAVNGLTTTALFYLPLLWKRMLTRCDQRRNKCRYS